MLGKMIIFLAAISVLLASGGQAVELVELTDANQAILNLELSKALKTVQEAISSSFNFEHVKDAVKCVEDCQFLKASMAGKSDEDFQGLAGKIKTILNEPVLSDICSIEISEFNDFKLLDKKDIGENLSKQRISDMVALGSNLNQHPKIELALGHLYETIKESMGEKLLEHVGKDTAIFFGEQKQRGWFDMSVDNEFKHGCEITTLKPICKLVRRTDVEDVSAIGADFADLRAALASGEQEKVQSHVMASGVSLEELKSTCEAIQSELYPIRVVGLYLESNFVNEQQIAAHSKIDQEFDFFYQLNSLCKQASL